MAVRPPGDHRFKPVSQLSDPQARLLPHKAVFFLEVFPHCSESTALPSGDEEVVPWEWESLLGQGSLECGKEEKGDVGRSCLEWGHHLGASSRLGVVEQELRVRDKRSPYFPWEN